MLECSKTVSCTDVPMQGIPRQQLNMSGWSVVIVRLNFRLQQNGTRWQEGVLLWTISIEKQSGGVFTTFMMRKSTFRSQSCL